MDPTGGVSVEHRNVSLGIRTKEIVGFSRAVRVGPFVAVGGTAPVDTVMAVTGFVNPDWLIEVEVDAVLTDAEAWRP